MVFPITKAIAAIVAIAIPDTPAASPSSPSIRLTALVTPTIQKIVSGIAIQLSSEEYVLLNGIFTKSTVIPKPKTTIQAAIIWPSSFTFADNSNRSSSAPISTISPPPHSSALMKLTSRGVNSYGIIGNTASRPNTNARKIANPPRRGIIFVCTLRAFGTSVAPILMANFFTKGVRPSASPMHTINPAMYMINI
ncbi:hypothetical protein D3C78_1044310 [compost metagenome]